MIAYYVIREVQPGAICSYPRGRTLCRESFLEESRAYQAVESFNNHCHVGGIRYSVLPHEEADPIDADHYEGREWKP